MKVMSMGFFQKDEEEAIIWRGADDPQRDQPSFSSPLAGVSWDYLDVDLPPGTSDAPLTVMQSLEMDGFVVVTTPQELAKIDAIRSVNMIKKLHIDVLGVVENLSGEIFGSGAGEELADHLDIPFLGSIEMRADYLDTSRPTVLNNDAVLNEYRKIADGVGSALVAA